MLAALRHGSFRWLFAAQVASALGNYIFTVGVAALLVEGDADASDLGLVLAAQAFAVVVFALPGGVISDRLPRRRVMVFADVTRTIGVAAIAIAGPDSSLALIIALTFAVGSGEALFQPAYRSLLPRVLPEDRLQAGNALSALSSQGALFAGPALAGVLIASVGPIAALVLSAGMFSASWLNLLGVRERLPEAASEETSLLTDALDGLRALRDRPWIAIVVAVSTVHLLVAIAPFEVLTPLVAEDDYGDVAVYGWLLALFGGGAVLGAVVGSRIRTAQPGTVAIVALIPFCILLAVLAAAPPFGVLAVFLLVAGAGEAIFEVLWTTSLQRDVPDRLLSRVISLDWLFSLALLPVGLALTGPVVDALGRSEVLLFGAGAALLLLLPLLLVDSVRRFSSAPAPARADVA